ncbi:predicted protein [Aspergillus terreus NIH2624]|uniref:Uncharacterized protein n=1 Tax=Aspergillus terreus (strain NIH 2624 / FGSC A1156) TaxID=341663 RepID=Q0C951_ASPTN|nr:uncharacterized protein ATEG_09783 [Aspergillus terreus NIH2624]EAU29974.1 predicted protein [Aspergillus terreus NIH2624]
MPTKKPQYNPPFNQLKILPEKIWPLLTLDQISDHDLAPYGIVREEFDIEAPDTVLGDKLPILSTPLSQRTLDKHPINKKALGFDHGDFKYTEEFTSGEGTLDQEKFTTRAEEAARYLQRWAWHGFPRSNAYLGAGRPGWSLQRIMEQPRTGAILPYKAACDPYGHSGMLWKPWINAPASFFHCSEQWRQEHPSPRSPGRRRQSGFTPIRTWSKRNFLDCSQTSKDSLCC